MTDQSVKVVPCEPTPEMMEQAAHNLCADFGVEFVSKQEAFVRAAWSELVSAAPSSPVGREEVEWRKPETLPHPKYAGVFFAAIQTQGINSPLKWEIHLIALDDETHDVHVNYDHGWRWEDYEFWTPCHFPAPPAPKAGE